MLITWFPPGTRAHGVPYAAGFEVADDPRRPRVLDGDPELFHHHSQISPYAQSHVAFALCFDHLVPRKEATAVHHQILNAMMPARVEGAVLTLGIQHVEPGPFGARDRSAIHGFASCQDLFRGRCSQQSVPDRRPIPPRIGAGDDQPEHPLTIRPKILNTLVRSACRRGPGPRAGPKRCAISARRFD